MALPGQTLKPLICQFNWIKALEGGAYSDPIEIMYVLEARIIIYHLPYFWESYIRSEICRFLFHLYFRAIYLNLSLYNLVTDSDKNKCIG